MRTALCASRRQPSARVDEPGDFVTTVRPCCQKFHCQVVSMQVIMEDPNADVRDVMFERNEPSQANVQAMAARAAEATRAAIQQGGGTGAKAAEATARDLDALRNLRVAPCVPVGSAAPVFVSRKEKKAQGLQQGAQGTGAVSNARKLRRKKGETRENTVGAQHARKSTQRRGAPRMQGGAAEDVFDQFAEDLEVLYSDTLAAEQAADAAIASSSAAAAAPVP